MSTKTQTVIELVKIKSWYIPADAASYQALKEAQVPLLIFHKDFLPTLQLATRRYNIRAKELLWGDLFSQRMDQIGAQWNSKKTRTCRITDSKLVFTSVAHASNRKSFNSLEVCLSKFFARWSFKYYPVFSEGIDKYKLVVEFKFDPTLLPVIPVVSVDTKREFEMVLGFTKLKLTFYDKPCATLVKSKGMVAPLIVLEVFTQTGDTWYPVHTSTVKPSQVGDVAGFMPGFLELFNRGRANLP